MVLGLRSITKRVQTNLEQATIAASTNSDSTLFSCSALSLQIWRSGKMLSLQNGRITMGDRAPNGLQNDPVLTKFSNCGKFLVTTLGSGIFVDNPSCDQSHHHKCFVSYHLLWQSPSAWSASERSQKRPKETKRDVPTRRRLLPRDRRLAAA